MNQLEPVRRLLHNARAEDDSIETGAKTNQQHGQIKALIPSRLFAFAGIAEEEGSEVVNSTTTSAAASNRGKAIEPSIGLDEMLVVARLIEAQVLAWTVCPAQLPSQAKDTGVDDKEL